MSNEITYWLNTELYPAVFQVADNAFPEHDFRLTSSGWISKTYLDGTPHKKRRDKTVIKNKIPSRILENGGEDLSIVDYVMKRNGVEFMEAVKILASVSGVMIPGFQNDGLVKYSYKAPIRFQEPEDVRFFDYRLVEESMLSHKDNNFVQSLKDVFTDNELFEMIHRFKIGTSKYWKGANVFWMIDNNANVTWGQVMLYDSNTNRVKGKITTVRSILNLPDQYKYCLYGLHQLNGEVSTIAIVESPKAASIMSVFIKKYTWMSTINLNGFNERMLRPLRGYNIIAYPDKGFYDNWKSIADELNQDGFNITVSHLIEENNFLKDRDDIGDYYLNKARGEINDSKERACPILAKPGRSNPDQSESMEIVYTNTELSIQKLGQINPAIYKLINAFDLVDGDTEQPLRMVQ